ncbi:MAG: putative sulfate exporter family transporter [Bradyrhizobium sp.]|uniref:YeiH family protein n=1 Tax=Bradyrhizobium sp. TaxID=376 RepID=UPI0025BEE2E3|nr:putative sulfate exporter family transporter [Bradyrhizobium sp.]MBI5263335.1 putative sulfate exporter family transporter [Bradyrhizobium sp.]
MSSVIVDARAQAPKNTVLVLAPGLAITVGIALIAYLASHNVGFLKNYQMIMAILLGMLMRNVIGMPAAASEGVAFSLRRILRFSIVLLGLQITAQQATEVGGAGIALIAVGLVTTLFVTVPIGTALGVPRGLSLLIGVGTSICGASAIIAAKAAVQGDDEDAAYAIASITLFGTASIFLYPIINGFLHLSPHDFGLWAGASIHEVAQVVATAFDGGPDALRTGTIAKLTRVAMMAPVIILLGQMGFRLGFGHAHGKARPPFPWFLVGFLAMVGVASFIAMPHTDGGLIDTAALFVRDHMTAISTATAFLLSMAMSAMGVHTDIRHIRSKGVRPLLVGLFSTLFISLTTLAMIRWFT